MSLIKEYPFDTPTNYTFSPNVSISGGSSTLNLIDNSLQTFQQPYTSSAGFGGDLAKVDFTGGLVQQKEFVYPDEMSGISVATGADADRAVGLKTATANNGASLIILGGKQYLDLSGGVVGKNWSYDPLNADFRQTGTIRFKVITGYGVTPPANRFLFELDSAGGNNKIVAFHQSTGNINLRINNQAGSLVSTTLHPWSPNGTDEDEIELDFNFLTGGSRLFINGVQSGPTLAGVFSRGAITNFSIGVNDGLNRPDFYIRDVQVFDEEQHTADFPGEVPRFVPNYQDAILTLPASTYTGLGNIQSFDSFASTEVQAPRYIINGFYWSGAAWAVSDGTYAQANSYVDINSNIVTLPISDTVDIILLFDATRLINSVDLTQLTYTGEIYPTNNPVVIFNSSTRLENIDGFVDDTTISGLDSVKYILKKDGVSYWHDGAAWVISNDTYSESNTAVEINTYKDDFTNVAVNVTICMLLHSDDGSTTPVNNSVTLSYDFTGDADLIGKTIVFGYSKNADGTPNTMEITATLCCGANEYKLATQVSTKPIVASPESTRGYWEMELIPSDDMEPNSYYTFLWLKNIRENKRVPSAEFISYNSLVEV